MIKNGFITDEELKSRMARFVEMFELVFEYDWDFSRGTISDGNYIEPGGTFLSPGVTDESNNWGNRGSLLHAYRELIEGMKAQGIYRAMPDH